MVFVDPEAGVRAGGVIALAYRRHLPLRARETCFGLVLEGERAVVREFLGCLRAAYPSGLFLKRRPFSIGDTKICARTFATRGLRRAARQIRYHDRS